MRNQIVHDSISMYKSAVRSLKRPMKPMPIAKFIGISSERTLSGVRYRASINIYTNTVIHRGMKTIYYHKNFDNPYAAAIARDILAHRNRDRITRNGSGHFNFPMGVPERLIEYGAKDVRELAIELMECYS